MTIRNGKRSRHSRGFRRLLKIATSMLLMAIAVAWLAALAYPIAIKLGFTESAASKLPNFGLLAGAALGLAACLAESVKQFLVLLSLIFATASVFWFFALVLESLLIHIGGVAELKLYWLPPAAFCFGFLLAAFAASVEVYEKIGAFIRRRRKSAMRH